MRERLSPDKAKELLADFLVDLLYAADDAGPSGPGLVVQGSSLVNDFDGTTFEDVIRDAGQMEPSPRYELSKNQQQFVDDAEEQFFKVDYMYSGRGMYGRRCPAVIEERGEARLNTTARISEDSMGLDRVVYAER